ncbi:CocE/NonD family hydrolase C-terminal non-catalytic domain-containing protein [Mycobacterium sp. NPDC051198]
MPTDAPGRGQTRRAGPPDVDTGKDPALDAVLQPGHRLRVSIYSSNYPSAVPPMPMMMAAGLTPPPYDVRDVALLFDRSNTFYPEHLDIDPAAPSWVSVPTSDPIA